MAPDPEILCWTTPTSIYTDILRRNSWGGDITWNLVLLLSPIQNFAAFILLSDSQRYPDSFQEHFEEGTHPGPLAPDPEILCWTTPTSIYTYILRKNSLGGDITWNLVLRLSPIQNFAAFILLSDSQRYPELFHPGTLLGRHTSRTIDLGPGDSVLVHSYFNLHRYFKDK